MKKLNSIILAAVLVGKSFAHTVVDMNTKQAVESDEDHVDARVSSNLRAPVLAAFDFEAENVKDVELCHLRGGTCSTNEDCCGSCSCLVVGICVGNSRCS